MNNFDTMSMSITSGMNKFEKCFMKMFTGATFCYYNPKCTRKLINDVELACVPKYIRKFQGILNDKGLKSQVQFVTNNGVENSRLDMCFTCHSPLKKWTDFRMCDGICLCIRIKELPSFSPEEMFELARKLESNNTVEFLEI